MALSKDVIHGPIVEGWKTYLSNFEQSLSLLEKDIDETLEMADACTAEWCTAVEHAIDDLSNALFSISEPRWSSDEDSKKLKDLKKRIHDAYAKYKNTAASA